MAHLCPNQDSWEQEEEDMHNLRLKLACKPYLSYKTKKTLDAKELKQISSACPKLQI